jgi:hypothetical protein
MYSEKITLERALELEADGQIVIVSTSSASDRAHSREDQWRDNYNILKRKAPHVKLTQLFNHYNTPYDIECKHREEGNEVEWRFFKGVENPNPSKIVNDNVEYVYILTNKDYPDLVKIGMTTKSPQTRLDTINSTGVVSHWKLAFSLPLLPSTSHRVEQQVHKYFADRRHHQDTINDKEMFFITVQEAIDKVRQVGQYFAAGQPVFYNN